MTDKARALYDRVRPHPSKASVVRLLFSLAIATVLWGWISTVEDPEDTIVFASVPIQVPALNSNLEVVTEPQQAKVTITAPESVATDISRSEISALLDLSEVHQSGSYTAPVDVGLDHAVRSIEVEPREVPIIVQETISEIKPLQFQPPDLEGGTREVGQLQPDATEVTITGSRSVMNTIDRVIVPIDIGDRTETFRAEFAASAVTSDGVRVNDVSIQPSSISVRVPISTRGTSVPVLVNVAGQPAAGFEEVYRTSNPPTVLIDGPPETLAQIPFASTTAIDVNGQTGSVQRNVLITGLPDGVTVLEPPSAEVSAVVQISPRGRRIVLENQPVTVVGVPPQLAASVMPPGVDIELLTNEGAGTEGTPESVTVVIDASQLPRGVHQLQPSVILPPNTEWLNVDPDRVTVQITDSGRSAGQADANDADVPNLPPPPADGR